MVFLDAKDKLRLLIVVSSFLERIWKPNAGLLWFQHVLTGFCLEDLDKASTVCHRLALNLNLDS